MLLFSMKISQTFPSVECLVDPIRTEYLVSNSLWRFITFLSSINIGLYCSCSFSGILIRCIMATTSLTLHYAEETSLHGIKRIFVSGSNHLYSRFGRLVWAICWLVAFGYSVYLIHNVLYRYLAYKSLTKYSIENNGSVPFPAVTICVMNPLKWSKVREWLRDCKGGIHIQACNHFNFPSFT